VASLGARGIDSSGVETVAEQPLVTLGVDLEHQRALVVQSPPVGILDEIDALP
jgi:hypothetical protein